MASFVRTPLNDIVGTVMNHQSLGPCAEFELNMVDCFENYGMTRGQQKCADYIDDLKECFQKEKQRARINAMKKERLKQWIEGKRTTKEFYNPPPPADSFY